MKSHPFSEVVTDSTAKFTKIKASDYHAQGRYKIIDQGKQPIAGYTDDTSLVNGQLLPIVIFGDHTRALKYVDEPIALGADGAKALWVNPDLANAHYVYYYLRSIQIKEAGYSRHFKFLKEIAIPIPFKDGAPDFDDQIRIAHLLGKVEGLIAQRKQHLQQLDDLLKSVFLEMFGDPVRNEKGWGIGSLTSYGTFKNGLNFGRGESGATVRYLGVGDFKSKAKLDDIDGLAFIELNELPAGDYFLQDADLLFVRSNGNRELVGRCMAVYPGEEKVTYSGFCIRYRINDPALQATYITHLFRSSAFRRVLFQGGQGVNIQNINQQTLSGLPIPIPAEELQSRFATIVERVESLKSGYQQSLTGFEALYGVLSQQAFKGELDLSRVPMPGIQAEEEKAVAVEPSHTPAEQVLAFHLPDTDNLLDALESVDARKNLLAQWLEAYRSQLGVTPFSVEHFMVAAQTRLAELHPDNDFDLGATDYEHIKAWVFEALADGRLTQAFDDAGNHIELKAVQP
jgi:type I restriction enzyme S subunit